MKKLTRKNHVSAEPFLKELLKKPEVRVRYEGERAKTRIAMAVYTARKRAQLSQTELAKKIGTSQSVIARLEGGTDSRVASMPLLASIAEACGGAFEFAFTFKRGSKSKLVHA